jgi:hypothetical protein
LCPLERTNLCQFRFSSNIDQFFLTGKTEYVPPHSVPRKEADPASETLCSLHYFKSPKTYPVTVILPNCFNFSVMVGIAKGYWLDSRCSIPGWGKIFFSTHNVQIGSGIHPDNFIVDTGGSFLDNKVADHSPPCNAKVKNGGDLRPLYYTSSWSGA